MISPLIRWNHADNHSLPMYDPFTRGDKRNVSISLSDPKYEYMKGHVIDGKFLIYFVLWINIII